MTDTNDNQPYKIIQEISCLDSPDALGELISIFTCALKRADIPPGAATIIQDNPDHLCITFRNAEEKDRFSDALESKKIDIVLLPDPGPFDYKELGFNPDNYKIVYTEGITPFMDYSGESAHLVEVCQKAGYNDFRVIFRDNELNVYLPKDESPAIFFKTYERLTREKEKAGIPIKTLRTASTPALRIVP